VDYTAQHDGHENFDDVVEDKIFKFKYRQFAHEASEHNRKNQRMINRFLERAKERDPILE
jgi:hypothetical protein